MPGTVASSRKRRRLAPSSSSSPSSDGSRTASAAAASPTPDDLLYLEREKSPSGFSNRSVVADIVSAILPPKPPSEARAVYQSKIRGQVLSLAEGIAAGPPVGAESSDSDDDLPPVRKLSKKSQQHAERIRARQPRLKPNRKAMQKMGTFGKLHLTWEQLQPLHQLWRRYSEELLPSVQHDNGRVSDAAKDRIVRMDFHGAIITVVSCQVPSVVGVEGIVILETKNNFRVITRKNRSLTIPKAVSVFALEVGGRVHHIHGPHICIHPLNRATRKLAGHTHMRF